MNQLQTNQIPMHLALMHMANVDVIIRGSHILHEVSLTLRPGAITVLTGPNGAGKSTLLRTLAGLIMPSSGRVEGVRISDSKTCETNLIDLRKLSDHERARLLSWTPPSTHVPFQFTAREVVIMGRWSIHYGAPDKRDEAVALDALEKTGSSHLKHRPWASLSTGEAHLVQLARTLAADTKVLLLDEPAASLDPASVLATVRIIRQAAAEGRAVCLSLHDLGLARRLADQVMLIHKGKVLAAGSPEATLSPENIKAAFDVRASLVATPGGNELFEFSSP
jgi:iron complex transport system ATP-binding protein